MDIQFARRARVWPWVALLLCAAPVGCTLDGVCVPGPNAPVTTVNFASNQTWFAFAPSTDGGHPGLEGLVEARVGLDRAPIGMAQLVCLNPLSPAGCASTALSYGSPYTSWTSDVSAFPGAQWIWAPGIDAGTRPADLAHYSFGRAIYLDGVPLQGTMGISVDDYAEVRINGRPIGDAGSLTDPAAAVSYAQLTMFDITSSLQSGWNGIVVSAYNGPASFSSNCTAGSCSYGDAPAGVVFGGTVTIRSCP